MRLLSFLQEAPLELWSMALNGSLTICMQLCKPLRSDIMRNKEKLFPQEIRQNVSNVPLICSVMGFFKENLLLAQTGTHALANLVGSYVDRNDPEAYQKLKNEDGPEYAQLCQKYVDLVKLGTLSVVSSMLRIHKCSSSVVRDASHFIMFVCRVEENRIVAEQNHTLYFLVEGLKVHHGDATLVAEIAKGICNLVYQQPRLSGIRGSNDAVFHLIFAMNLHKNDVIVQQESYTALSNLVFDDELHLLALNLKIMKTILYNLDAHKEHVHMVIESCNLVYNLILGNHSDVGRKEMRELGIMSSLDIAQKLHDDDEDLEDVWTQLLNAL